MKPNAFFMWHRARQTEQIYETKSIKNMYFAEKKSANTLFDKKTRRLNSFVLQSVCLLQETK